MEPESSIFYKFYYKPKVISFALVFGLGFGNMAKKGHYNPKGTFLDG
jgi:hypothetical protein